MIFTVPVNDKVTVTDTPVGAKSIRSFWFVDRTGGKDKFFENGLMTCSISIDGKDICRDLFINPFFVQHAFYENMIYSPYDTRRVSIRCNVNVCMSEIRISNSVKRDFDVVFEMSDTEVDEENCEYIESFAFTPSFVYATPTSLYGNNNVPRLSLAEMEMGKELVVNAKYAPERFFVNQFYAIEDSSNNAYADVLMNAQMPNYWYYAYMGNSYSGGERMNITFETADQYMTPMPLNMISPYAKTSWKEVQYTFDKRPEKNFRFTINSEYDEIDPYHTINGVYGLGNAWNNMGGVSKYIHMYIFNFISVKKL